MMNFLNTLKTVFNSQDNKVTYNYMSVVDKAHDLIEAGELEKSYELLQEEVAAHPENGYAHYGIAVHYLSLNEYGAALNSVNSAIRNLLKDNEWLAAAFNIRGEIYEALGNGKQAMLDWHESARLNPKETAPIISRAEYFFRQNEYDSSDVEFKKVSDLDLGNPYPVVAMGRNDFMRGNYDEAQKKFEYAIKLAPKYSFGYSSLAECLFIKEDWDGVIENCISALRLNKNDQKAGDILMDRLPVSQRPLAIGKLEAMAREMSNNAFFPNLIGHLYFFNQQYVESIEWYEESFKRSGLDMPLANMSRSLYLSGNYYKARLYAEKALTMNPQNDNAQGVLVHTLLSLDLYEEARCAMEKYLQYARYDACFLRLFAETYRYCKDLDKALETINAAINIEPTVALGYFVRATIMHDLGLFDNEQNDLHKVLTLSPATDNYNEIRCRALQMLGLNEDAWTELRKGEGVMDGKSTYEIDKALSFAIDGRNEEAIEMLKKSFADGHASFEMVRTVASMEPLREIPGFEDVISLAERSFRDKLSQESLDESREDSQCGEVPFTREGDCLNVKGEINGLPLKFVFDTGASNISISSVEAAFMLKNGYLEERDLGGVRQYQTASGDIIEGTIVNLRNITIGDITLHDIRATIIKNQNAPLLLGQSFLVRMTQFNVDNEEMKISFITKSATMV